MKKLILAVLLGLILLTVKTPKENIKSVNVMSNDSVQVDTIKIDTIKIDSQKVTKVEKVVSIEKGHWTATYYGNTYKTARRTANGERFNMNAMTCAAPPKHKFGTMLRVTNLANNKSVVVRVTDRGHLGHYTIDLTHGAFGKIAKHRDGRVKIKVEVLKK
jgi:rare lipoprotein A (peptidoglycan hydrolase)